MFARRFSLATFVVACAATLALALGQTGQARPQAAAPSDPAMANVVRAITSFGIPPINTLTPFQARNTPGVPQFIQQAAVQANVPAPLEQVGSVKHVSIPGPAGPLLTRVYTPRGAGPFPVLVYYHGGGWVISNLDGYDSSARALTNAAGTIVVSVAYRQAPEAKFPAAANDAYAAYRWVKRNAASLNGIATRVAVGGESAGGNLAAVVSQMARDRQAPMPTHQLLVYPVTNRAFNTLSYRQHANAIPLNRPLMQWFWGRYLRRPADARNPYASPLRARSFRNLPPATIVLAEIDPLRSEGEAYGARLRQAGVPVTVTVYPGLTHEFFGMGAVVPRAKDAVGRAAAALGAS